MKVSPVLHKSRRRRFGVFRSRDDLKYLVFFDILSSGSAIYTSITVLSIDRHRSNLDYFTGAHDPCTHVATRRSINGRLKVRFGSRLAVPFRRALSEDRARIGRVSSRTIGFNRDRFERVLSIHLESSSSSLYHFSWTFFSFVLSSLPSFSRLHLYPRRIQFPITPSSCTRRLATGSSNDPTT